MPLMMDRSMERANDRVTYRCRLCRQQLFDGSCVLNTSTNHHQDVATTPSSSTTAPATQEYLPTGHSPLAVPSTSWSITNEAQDSVAVGRVVPGRVPGPKGTCNGVLAPYGQVTAGPNPLWFISEDSPPLWVQKTLDKCQWKKGKLSCPKCHGRIGSFDFVTPFKLGSRSQKVSHIQVMRSRVDCESASPIVARIRPMPQSPSGRGYGHSSGTAPSPTISAEREPAGATSPDLPDTGAAVPLNTTSFLQSLPDSSSRQFLPESFSSTSDEEPLTSVPNSNDYQRMAVAHPGEGQRHHVTSRSSSVVTHMEQALQAQASTSRIGKPHMVPVSQSSHAFPSSGVRRRTVRPGVPVDKPLSLGLDITHMQRDGDVVISSSSVERNIAYVAGTNRTQSRVTQVKNHCPPILSSSNFSHYRMEDQRRSHQHVLQYDSRSDEHDDDDNNEQFRNYSSNSSNVSSAPMTATHSRPMDVSANIFKNNQTFLHPFVGRGYSVDRTGGPSSSSSSSVNLYSQIHPSTEQQQQQPERDSPIPNEIRLPVRTAQNMISRDSDEEEENGLLEDLMDQVDSIHHSSRPRSAREQRRERNRKKKERRKQRRYERWLERQTLGAEEESAIQDISAAGLYTLLGPRCAGSSLREVTTCSVCLDIYYQPYTCSPCEHIFCEPCLRQVARFHPVVTPCPLCRTTIRTVKLHEQLTSAVKQLFPRQFENRHQMERRTLNRSFPLPGWYRMGYQNNRNPVDLLALRRNPGYVHDWGMRYLQGVVWRVVASTVVLLIVSGISVGFLHFMFDFS